jgi:hypothetical protein
MLAVDATWKCSANRDPIRSVRKSAMKTHYSFNMCARLFPDQEVMQTACRTGCTDHSYSSPGDAQECAFKFARASREVAPPPADDHTVLSSVVLILIMIPAAWFGYQRHRKRPEKLETPEYGDNP